MVTQQTPADSDESFSLSLISDAIDVDYYVARCHSVGAAVSDFGRLGLAAHYLEHGADLDLDPIPQFSGSYYLATYPDVREAGMNPFEHYLCHGREEGRTPLPGLGWVSGAVDYESLPSEIAQAAKHMSEDELKLAHGHYFGMVQPLVSVIVPNYNHGRFLIERLDSILEQSYGRIEVIVLDDCSSDDSLAVIERYRERHPEIVVVANEQNSGNVFRQWRKGFELARGDLVWVCESDDSAERDFLERLVPAFEDMAVMVAFGRVQFSDAAGRQMDGLDAYRESVAVGIWENEFSSPAAHWFDHSLSVKNLIPNVGGCLIRRQPVSAETWRKASSYSVLGDWFLYLELSRGGKILYNPHAVTYFRQHGKNTSVESFRSDRYFEEHRRLADAIRSHWSVSEDASWLFYKQLQEQFDRRSEDLEAPSLLEHISLDALLVEQDRPLHVLIGFLGFQVGGGELFPIHLANELLARGLRVSMLALDPVVVDQEVRGLLNKSIPVYSVNDVEANGPAEFIRRAAIDLVHSHHIGVELAFFEASDEVVEELPYVASLHGTYEVTDLPEYRISRLARGVKRWVYTTEKNLQHLDVAHRAGAPTIKMSNAMPDGTEPWLHTREEMGISDESFVFCLIARPMPEKGWEAAIGAVVRMCNEEPDLDITLLLVGDNEYKQNLEERWGNHPALRFLGFQPNADGLLAFSDCCLLPTRFAGESHPLVLIQSLKAGTPCIATDAGEIGAMLRDEKSHAGIVIDWLDDDNAFVDSLIQAMKQMSSHGVAKTFAEGARERAADYSLERLAGEYEDLYREVCAGADADDEIIETEPAKLEEIVVGGAPPPLVAGNR